MTYEFLSFHLYHYSGKHRPMGEELERCVAQSLRDDQGLSVIPNFTTRTQISVVLSLSINLIRMHVNVCKQVIMSSTVVL